MKNTIKIVSLLLIFSISACAEKEEADIEHTAPATEELSDEFLVDIMAHYEIMHEEIMQEFGDEIQGIEAEYESNIQDVLDTHGITREELLTDEYQQQRAELQANMTEKYEEVLKPIQMEYEKRMEEIASQYGYSFYELDLQSMRERIIGNPELMEKLQERIQEIEEG